MLCLVLLKYCQSLDGAATGLCEEFGQGGGYRIPEVLQTQKIKYKPEKRDPREPRGNAVQVVMHT